jgi:thiamine-phosphate pyrophosphorylase
MQLYAITDRHLLPGAEQDRRTALIERARDWAKNGVNYIQIREKDLDPSELGTLTEKIVAAVRNENQTTQILLNGAAEIALDANADGVHLPASASQNAASYALNLFHRARREATISQSCHNLEEIRKATSASLILYAPVFEKITQEGKLPGHGLEALKAAAEVARPIPVFALGGVTIQNAPSCIQAGAAGIAGIRIFLESNQTLLI